MFRKGAEFVIGHFHSDAFGQIALNVLEDGGGGAAGEPVELHTTDVCARLVLHFVLLVDVLRFEHVLQPSDGRKRFHGAHLDVEVIASRSDERRVRIEHRIIVSA